jgi:phage recombination protein Bet
MNEPTNAPELSVAKVPAKSAMPAKRKALEVMADRCSVDPAKLLATLKATVFAKASDEEMLALVVVANEYRLNPFLKEIYAFPAKGGGIVPVISIDGWVKLVNQHPNLDGLEFEAQDSEDGSPYACTCRIFIKGRSRPVSVTEYYAECKRNTEPWNQMPRRMLRHKALIQAARVAFGFAGIQDEDEARGFDNARRVTVTSVETVRPDFGQLPAPEPAKITAAVEVV